VICCRLAKGGKIGLVGARRRQARADHGVLTNVAKAHGGYSVLAGVGERTREANDLYLQMIESKVNIDPKKKQTADQRFQVRAGLWADERTAGTRAPASLACPA